MVKSRYVIVGGGMAADAAVRGIREVDAAGEITLISAEPDPPYKRPPLSKGLWHGKPVDRIWLKTGTLGVELKLGRSIRWIDRHARCVVDDRGESYKYEILLLATGSSPRRLPLDDDRIVYFRTLDDYRRLRRHTQEGRRFAVIGAGFIGSELAAALASNGKDVSLIFPGAAIGESIFPHDLAHHLNGIYRDQGVEVLAGHEVTGVHSSHDGVTLNLTDVASGEERQLQVDSVVGGIGVQPNVQLAELAGLTVDNGIVVDQHLRTSDPHIFAAGDVANVYEPALGTRRRVEHEDNATAMGRAAGRAMAGAQEPYDHLPSFYSDLFDLGYEAVGELDSRLEVVADWTTPFHEGTIYYLKDGRVRGVLLWNVWDQVDAARELIRRCKQLAPAALIRQEVAA